MKQLLKRNRELLLYAVFGVGTVAVDVCLYSVLVDRVGIQWANAWGWCGAVLFAFLTNKYFVFCTGGKGGMAFWREFAEFLAARLLSLVIEVQGVALLVKHGFSRPVLGITGGAAKIVITGVVILLNYLLSKFLVFRPREARL